MSTRFRRSVLMLNLIVVSAYNIYKTKGDAPNNDASPFCFTFNPIRA